MSSSGCRRCSTSPSTGSSAPPTRTTTRRRRRSGSGWPTRGDIYLDSYSGWYSVRDERFFTESETALDADGTRIATETGTPVTWTEEQTYFFRLSAYADRLLAHYEANPGLHRARGAPQRGGQLRLRRPARPVDLADLVRPGACRCPTIPAHVMYVWVDALTNYLTGVGYPGHRLRAVPPVLARRSAHDRQGHHPVPHRLLAGVPDVGGNRAAAAGLRARLPLQPRREDEQVGGQRRRSRRAGRDLRRRSGPLLPAARGAVRPGRQLQRRGHHHPDQHRPGQRAGQPRAALAVDGQQEPRRRGARRPASSAPRTASCWRSPTACWRRCGRRSTSRRCTRRWRRSG